MKNRRLTIFCVAVIAIAGAPRVWQEAGKLLALVQHKAQVKFWSMVLQPTTGKSAGAELIASAQPFETGQASFDTGCPLKNVEWQDTQVWNNSKQPRKVASVSVESKARAQRPAAVAPLSHAELIAKALKAPRGDSRAESLRHSRNTFDGQLLEITESRQSLLARHSPAGVPFPPAGKADTFKFVMLPAMSPVAASALMEKESVVQFKLLKKTFEEPKLIRQKTRLPVGRGAVAFFPST